MRLISLLSFFFIISVHCACSGSKQTMTLHRVHGQNTYLENIYIWENQPNSGRFVGMINGKNKAGTTVDYEFCVNAVPHTFVFEHASGSYWSTGSYVAIQNGGVTLAQHFVDRLGIDSIVVYPYQNVNADSTWKYSTTEVENWSSASFDASSWSSAVAGSFPAIEEAALNRFYRVSFAAPTDVSGLQAFELGVFTKLAFELYLNGEEILSGDAVSESVYHRISLPLSKLPSESIVLAIVTHATEAGTDDFKGFFGLIAPSSNRVFEGSCASNHAADIVSEGMEKAFDNDRKTKWYASAYPAHNTFIFANRREFINAYSVTSTGGLTERRPTQWTLSGSNNGEAWTVLDKRAVTFTAMYQTKKFALPCQTESYAQYKIEFTGTGALEVAMIQLLIDDVTPSSAALAYPQQSVELFVGQTNVYIAPICYFEAYSTTSTLPQGLTFSTTTGTISGVPTAAFTGIVSISATGASTPFALSLTVVACGSEKTRVDIVKHDAGLGSADQWVLKSGTTVIDAQVGRDVFDSQVAGDEVFSYCLAPATYSLTLTQKFGKGWSNAAYIDVLVYLDDEETRRIHHHTLLPYEQETVMEFNTLLYSDNDMSAWKYKADGTVPANWYSTSFSDAWTAVPETRPSVSQSVWLLRRTISVTSVTGFMGFELGVYARAGAVVYLNGAEYFRVGVTGSLSGSSTSSLSSTTPVWKFFYGRVGTGHLIAGQNTIAIAIVNSNNAQASMDVKVSLRLTTAADISMGLDTTVVDSSHENDSSVGANLFHGDYSKRFKAVWSNTDITITATFGGAAYVNTYCTVASWNGPDNFPGKWTVSTSTDGSIFSEAVTVDKNIMRHTYERTCFTFANTNALRAIRFIIKAPADPVSANIQLNAIDLYYTEVSQVTVPALSYGGTVLTAVAGEDTVIQPNSLYYHSFSISPALPTGLVLRGNGLIEGRAATVVDGAMFTVTAKTLSGDSAVCLFSLAVTACGDANSIIRFATGDTSGAGDRMVIILTSSEETVYVNENIADYTLSMDWAKCLPSSIYTFTLIHREGEAWNNQYTVYAGTSETSGSVTAAATPVSVVLSTLQYITQGTQSFEYTMPDANTPSDYFLQSTARNWSSAKPGEFPAVPSYTSIYCTTFNAESLDLFGTVNIAVKVKGGFILYVNGNEVNRVNLPASSTFSTPASSAFAEDTFVEFIDSAQLGSVLEGENFVCVEVHKKTVSASEVNTFDMYIRPMAGGRDVIVDGTSSASHAGYYDSNYDERYPNVFDKETNNKWFTNDSSCSNQYADYVFNSNRKEYANHLKLYSGNGNHRNPHTVTIKGSNSADVWDTLFTGDVGFSSTSGYGRFVTFDFYPSKPYSAYRFVFNGCSSEGIEVGEILLYSNSITGSYCRPHDGIKGAIEGGTSEGPCGDAYTGSVTYRCTNGQLIEELRRCVPAAPKNLQYPESAYELMTKDYVEIVPTFVGVEVTFSSLPTLPDGLTLDPATGVIKGTPSTATGHKSYVILCKNVSGSAQTTVEITVTAKPTPVWVYIVIAVVVIIVIVGIVFGVIACVKNKKGKKGKKPVKKLPKTAPKAPAAKPAAKVVAKPAAQAKVAVYVCLFQTSDF